MSSPRRADRVSREIQRLLTRLVQRETRDPRISAVTFTRVDLSDDLREATVGWVPLGALASEEAIEELQLGLKAASGFLQRRVGQELNIRFTPRLRFRYDRGMENVVRVHELFEELGRGAETPEETE
jgi:ribosome-binding factor A